MIFLKQFKNKNYYMTYVNNNNMSSKKLYIFYMKNDKIL